MFAEGRLNPMVTEIADAKTRLPLAFRDVKFFNGDVDHPETKKRADFIGFYFRDSNCMGSDYCRTYSILISVL